MTGYEDEQEKMKESKIKKRRPKQEKKSNVVGTVTGAVMIAGAVLPMMPAMTAYAASTGTMSVDKSFVAVGESVNITVTDTNNGDTVLNTDSGSVQTTTVAVSSPDDALRSPLMITLTETGANTGIFQGSLKLVDTNTTSPAANEIKVQNNNAVSILDPNWDNPDALSPIVINVTRRDYATGAVKLYDNVSNSLINSLVHDGQVVRVELTDADLNTSTTTVQTRAVNLTTTAGVNGNDLILTETGNNTGVFEGTFTVGDDIAPAHNERFYIEYADEHMENTLNGTVTKTLLYRNFSAAALTVTPGTAATNEPITVELTDLDLNLDEANAENVSVKISSQADSTGLSLTLTETGANTGVFRGSFEMEAGATNAGAHKISVANNGTVTINYTDLRDAAGLSSSITDTVVRKDHTTANVALDKSFVVVGETVTVTVTDLEFANGASNESLSVNVASSITDSAGIDVFVTETNDTGVFTGTFVVQAFTDASATPKELGVGTNLEMITATYLDNHKADNTSGTVTYTAQRKDRMTGILNYSRLSSPDGELIQVELQDTDLDTLSNVAESVNVAVRSTDDETGFVLSLKETGVNTAMFVGTFKPVRTETNSTNSPQELQVLSYGTNMIVTYTDFARANNTPGNIVTTFANVQIPKITSIAAAEAGDFEVGAGEEDTVTIVFDIATNMPTIAAADIASALILDEGSWGTVASAAWSNSQTLVVTLGSGATLKNDAVITIDGSAAIKNAAGTSASSVASEAINGTFGSQVPAISSITAEEGGDLEVGAGAGDTVTIVFDVETNQPTLDAANLATTLELSAGSWGTVENGLSVAWSNSRTLVVTLGSNATVKKGATITLDSSANVKDIGEESLASTASSTISSGTFYSAVPRISSVTAAEGGASDIGAGAGDTLTIVFDIATDQPAIAPGTLATALGLSAGSWGTGASAAWSDSSTLVVTLGTGATVKKGETLTLDATASIRDIGQESLASTASAVIGGTFGSQVPAITSVTAAEGGASEVGAGAGDTVTIVFDVPTNQPVIAAADIATALGLSAGSWGTGPNGLSAAWSSSQTLVVTLGTDATVKKGATITLSASAGITDIGEESAASTDSAAINGTFGSSVPIIVSVIAAEDGVEEVGAGAGDTVTIAFDVPTNQPAIAAVNIATALGLSAGSWGTEANGLSVAWSSNQTLVVTLGSDATVKKGATITLNATAGIKDIGAESAASTASALIDGTFFSKVPNIVSVTAAEDGAEEVGAGAGDTVTIVFDEQTNRPAIAAASIATALVLNEGSWGTEANGLSATWSNSQTLVVTLGSDATVKKGATITLDVSAGIKDIGEESAASTVNAVIDGTFFSQVPSIVSVTAAEGGAIEVGAGAGDTLTIEFDVPTNQPVIAAANIATFLGLNAGSWGTGANGLSAVWSNSQTLVVTLGSDATVKKGATITLDTLAGIKDIGEESAASTVSAVIDGTFFSQVPSIVSVMAAEAGASEAGAGAGDTVTIVFDVPTNQPVIAAGDVATALGLSEGSWGTGLSAAWSDSQTLVVTLGSGATVKKGATITLNASAGIKDIGAESTASTADAVIDGSFGVGAIPAITSVTAAEDGAEEVGAGAGDTVTIAFNVPTNQPAIAAANIATALGLSAGSWGTEANGLSAAWSSNQTLVVTLGSDATVKKGATITLNATAGIKDIGAESAASTASALIDGTFFSKVPNIVSVTAAEDGAEEVGAGAGDTVTIVFDEQTNRPAIAAASIATALVLNEGSWGTEANGLSATWSNSQTLVVTLGSDATVKKGATITLDVSAGIKDIGEESAASTVNAVIDGTFFSQVPSIVSVTAAEGGAIEVGAGAGDTLTIEFDVPTNQPVIAAANIATFLGLNAGSWGTGANGLSAAWSDSQTLVVTLGSDATVKKGASISLNSLAGILDIGEESLASTDSTAIEGTFGSQLPSIVSVTAAEGGIPEVGAGLGDTVTIVFDTPTNQPTIAPGDIATALGLNKGIWGTGATAAWTDNQTLVVTLGSDATVRKDASITLNASAGIKDIGEESVVSTDSAVIGGTFGVGTVPNIVAIEATNDSGLGGVDAGDKVTIKFSTLTNQADVDLTYLTLSSSHTWGTGASVEWSAADTLVITLGNAATIAVGDTLSIAAGAGIKDVTGESVAMVGNGVISGTFGASTAPVISSVVATNGGGTAFVEAGDTIVITFNTAFDKTGFDSSKITVSGGRTFGTGATFTWSTESLTIVLGANPTIQIGDELTFEAGNGIYDATGHEELAEITQAIGGNFGVAVAPKLTNVYASNSNGTPGAGEGDRILFVFDTPTNKAAVGSGQFTINNGHTLGTSPTFTWSADGQQLTVTLGAGANVTKNDTISIGAASGISEVTGVEALAATGPIAINGSFGEAEAPSVITAIAANNAGIPGTNAGDTLTFIFDKATNQPAIANPSSLIGVSNGHSLGAGATAVWFDNGETLRITLGTGATVTTTDTISIQASNGIFDEWEAAEFAGVLNLPISGSFGTATAPVISSVVATNGGGTAFVEAGDTIVITFDTAFDSSDFDSSKITVNNGHTFGTGASFTWSNESLTIVLGANPTIQIGDELTFEAGNGIYDATGHEELAEITQAIGGNFGVAVAPKLTNVYASNSNGTPGAGEGDRILFVFDTPTNKAAVGSGQFTINNGHTLGTSPTFTWSADGQQLTVTLGAGANVTKNDTISIGASSGISEVTGVEALAATGPIAINGSFGEAEAPSVITAIAANNAGIPGTNAGDTLTFIFDKATNQPAIANPSSLIGVSNGHSLGVGATAVWLDNGETLRITLGTGATVTTSDTITIQASNGIFDEWAAAEFAGVLNLPISGSFGTAAAPVISSVIATNGGGTAYVEAGDTIVITFNTAFDSSDFDSSKITVNNGHTFGTGASFNWSNESLTIVLGANPTIQIGDELTFEAGNGIYDATGQEELAEVAKAIGGNFGVAVAPGLTSVYATNANGTPGVGAGDRIIFTFDTRTNAANVDLSKFNISNSHTFGENATFAWSNDGLRLTVTLGAGASITTADKISIGASSGITEVTGAQALAPTSDFVINGSFGYTDAPTVIALIAANNAGQPGTNTGDTLTLIFDMATNRPIITDLSTIIEVSNGKSLGSGATATWLDNGQTLRITLGSGASITTNDTITIKAGNGIYDSWEFAELTAMGGLTINGTFGDLIVPNIISVVGSDKSGTTESYGDQLIITFDTPTNGIAAEAGIIRVTNSEDETLDLSYSALDWSQNNQVLSVTISTYSSVTASVYANVRVGDILDLSGLGIRDITNSVPVQANELVITGSFAPGLMPRYSAVATSNDRSASEGIYGTIELIFTTAMDRSKAVDIDDIIVSNGHTFGDGATLAWTSDNVLTITVKNGATVEAGDLIDLSALELMDANHIAYIDVNDVQQVINGSFGSVLLPEIINIVAINTDGHAGAGAGDRMIITFNSSVAVDTDVFDLSQIEISNGHDFGENPTFEWSVDNTFLTITLGNGTTITAKDTLSILAGNGIYDLTGMAQMNAVSGLQIGGSFGEGVAPAIVSIVASSDDKLSEVIGLGSKITITFDMTVNQTGELSKSQVDEIVGFGSKVLGTDYSGLWVNGNQLIITVTDAEGSTLATGDSITVIGVKNVYGTSDAINETKSLTGSFDGRQVSVESYALNRITASKMITSEITLQAIKEHAGTETVVFQLMKGDTAVQISTTTLDIIGLQKLAYEFSGLAGDLNEYSVKVFILDNLTSDLNSTPELLAQIIELK